jgi:DNA-binding LacI/PurR family transcriptional regulator
VHGIPQRQPLVGQTVAFLKAQTAADRWGEWLPPERALCEQLQVSRSTLRRAIAQLRREGLISAEHGSGNRVVGATQPRRGRRLRSHDVALLAPEPLERLRPTQALWIDELRAMLAERGCRLHVFHGQQYFRAQPRAALEKLVRQHPHGCWILTLASAASQQWFAQHGPPCIVAGSCHAGIDLAFRDLDHRAMCRHAAGVLLGLGHRKLVLIAQQTPRLAGDIESAEGFLEGVRQSRHANATAAICHPDGTPAGIAQLLARLMRQTPAPTALLVANAFQCLAVVSGLTALSRRVPADVSIISRDDDAFLSFLMPEPARYVASPRAFARSLLHPVLELLENSAVTRRGVRLMPRFVRGASLAPAVEAVK